MLTEDIHKTKIPEVDARKMAAFTSKDASYDKEREELTFTIENALQEAHRLIWEDGEVFTLVEGTDKTVTSTLHIIEEFETNLQALDRLEEVSQKMQGWISVKHSKYAAIGDGETDDTVAIQKAANAAVGSTLYMPHSSGTYRTTSKIIIPKYVNVVMDGRIEYDGSKNETALEIGTEGGVAHTNPERILILDVKRKIRPDWLSEDSIGIKLINLYTSHVTIKRASGFTIGAQCIGAGMGFVYNTVNLGVFYGNKIGLDITNKSVGADCGWSIDNIFSNGQFSTATSLNPTTDRIGVRITAQGSVIYTNASNFFIKPSFEIGADSATAVPAVIEHGNRNTFLACREESGATTLMRVENESAQNIFELASLSTVSGVLDDQSDHPSNLVRLRENRLLDDTGTKIFDSGPIWKNACYYDGNTNLHIPGMCWMKPEGATIYTHGIATFGDERIVFDWAKGGAAVFVDTTESKRFILVPKVPTGGATTTCRIRCYAANGTVLNGNSTTYLRGGDESYWSDVSWNTYHGGVYTAAHASAKPLFFSVTDHVKKVCVGYPGTCDLSSFAIYNVDGREAHVWSGYEDIVKGQNIGICPPTTGTHKKGKVVLNANTTNTDSPFGWQCINPAPPGTWRNI